MQRQLDQQQQQQQAAASGCGVERQLQVCIAMVMLFSHELSQRRPGLEARQAVEAEDFKAAAATDEQL